MISVIMPIYKVEKYLDRTISSVLSQTHTDLELLLVDDGSPDNSGAICDEWAKKDPRIKVFHIPNSGVSYARNYGIERAQGEYIAFIDSDDFVKPEWLSDMYSVAKNTGADLVKGSLVRFVEDDDDLKNHGRYVYHDIAIRSSDRFENEQISAYEYHRRLITDYRYSTPIHLIKSDIQKKCLFAVGKRNEDYLCYFSILEYTENIQIIDSVCYCYGTHEDSITTSRDSSFSSDIAENSVKHSKIFILKYNDKKYATEALRRAMICFFYHTIGSERIDHIDYNYVRELWHSICYTINLIGTKNIVPPEIKTQYYLCKISLPLYLKLVKIKKGLFSND